VSEVLRRAAFDIVAVFQLQKRWAAHGQPHAPHTVMHLRCQWPRLLAQAPPAVRQGVDIDLRASEGYP
jgi:hypothetical protein